jgi:hypothetical protein
MSIREWQLKHPTELRRNHQQFHYPNHKRYSLHRYQLKNGTHNYMYQVTGQEVAPCIRHRYLHEHQMMH